MALGSGSWPLLSTGETHAMDGTSHIGRREIHIPHLSEHFPGIGNAGGEEDNAREGPDPHRAPM